MWVIETAAGEVVLESNTCLLPKVTTHSQKLIELYGHYKNNTYPYSGGILEQPAYYEQAMRHIDRWINALKARPG